MFIYICLKLWWQVRPVYRVRFSRWYIFVSKQSLPTSALGTISHTILLQSRRTTSLRRRAGTIYPRNMTWKKHNAKESTSPLFLSSKCSRTAMLERWTRIIHIHSYENNLIQLIEYNMGGSWCFGWCEKSGKVRSEWWLDAKTNARRWHLRNVGCGRVIVSRWRISFLEICTKQQFCCPRWRLNFYKQSDGGFDSLLKSKEQTYFSSLWRGFFYSAP